MSIKAGHQAKVYIGTTSTFGDSTTKALNSCTNISFSGGADKIDTSSIGAGQWKTSIQGMKELEISIECQKDDADDGQGVLRTLQGSGATGYLWYLPDGTNGKYYPVVVFSDDLASATADANTESFSCSTQAAPTAHP